MITIKCLLVVFSLCVKVFLHFKRTAHKLLHVQLGFSHSFFLSQEMFVFGDVAVSGDNDDEDRQQLREKLATVKRSWAGQVGMGTSPRSSAAGREKSVREVPKNHIYMYL